MRKSPRLTFLSRITASVALPMALSACGGLGSTDGGLGGGGPGAVQQAFKCPESPATDLFAASLCICEDFLEIGNLQLYAGANGERAFAGVNGFTRVMNNTQVRGDFIAYGGLDAKANFDIDGNLESAGDVFFAGNMDVEGDMSVAGDISGFGRLKVAGGFSVGGQNGIIGWSEIGTERPFSGAVAEPCGCRPEQIFNVAQAVSEARIDNDNEAAGLPYDISVIGVAEITLTDGVYYLKGLDTIGKTRLYIDGVVALYIDGNLKQIGDEQIQLADGAILDLYVSGSVGTIGNTVMGSAQNPSSFRLYVGGTDPVVVQVGNNIYNGAIYAPQAEVKYIGNTQIKGAVFTKRLKGIGNLEIGYAGAKNAPADSCGPPDKIPELPQDPKDPKDPVDPGKNPDGSDPDKDPPIIK